MPTDVCNPLEVQDRIVAFVANEPSDGGPVRDCEVADALGVDLPTVRVHLELLAAENRVEVLREETVHRVLMTDEQRRRFEAPPPHVAAQQRLIGIDDALESIQETVNRIVAWAPLALMLAGATLGWFASAGSTPTESTFYFGLFGLMIGLMLRRELSR